MLTPSRTYFNARKCLYHKKTQTYSKQIVYVMRILSEVMMRCRLEHKKASIAFYVFFRVVPPCMHEWSHSQGSAGNDANAHEKLHVANATEKSNPRTHKHIRRFGTFGCVFVHGMCIICIIFCVHLLDKMLHFRTLRWLRRRRCCTALLQLVHPPDRLYAT